MNPAKIHVSGLRPSSHDNVGIRAIQIAPSVRPTGKATLQRVLRSTDDPNEVFIYLEFDHLDDANEARDRLLASGVLDRFEDKHGPSVLVDAG